MQQLESKVNAVDPTGSLYRTHQQANLLIDNELLPSYMVSHPAYPGPGDYTPKSMFPQKACFIGENIKQKNPNPYPGPGQYNPVFSTQQVRSQNIKFCEDTVKNKRIEQVPGPADYEPLDFNKVVIKRSMSWRTEPKNKRDVFIPPDKYKIENNKSTFKTSCAFSFGGRNHWKERKSELPPPPTKYTINFKSQTPQRGNFSFGKPPTQPNPRNQNIQPSPNQYNIKYPNDTKKGQSMGWRCRKYGFGV